MRVLVICGHPDDEVIAVGGTIRKLADAGAVIRLVIFSEGTEGYADIKDKQAIVATRRAETQKVCAILGIQEYFNLRKLDWNLKVDNDAYHSVIHHIREFGPNLLLTHSRADYNDHIAVHDVVQDGWFHASVPCAMAEGDVVPRAVLYEFEVMHQLSAPSVIVDITDTYEAKVEAMMCYASQHELVGGVFQMIEGRALSRGAQAGVKYGEALLRNSSSPRLVRNVIALKDNL